MLRDTLEAKAAQIDRLCEEMSVKGYGTLVQLGELKMIAAELRGIAVGLGESAPPPSIDRTVEQMKVREAQKRTRQEEAMSQVILTVRGGPLDGTSIPCPSGVPDGAHTMIGGIRYTVSGGELLHDPDTQAKLEGQGQ